MARSEKMKQQGKMGKSDGRVSYIGTGAATSYKGLATDIVL